jgi:hypothetical protein
MMLCRHRSAGIIISAQAGGLDWFSTRIETTASGEQIERCPWVAGREPEEAKLRAGGGLSTRGTG